MNTPENVVRLDRLSILLAEDNSYIRDILKSILKNVGFGHVTVASNGEEAIEILRTMGKAGVSSGPMAVDMVLSDLVMSPINGLLLLRWLRSGKDSPNRFMPVIMISGAADSTYVQAARDYGVTEFLAKPFSVQSVADRLMLLIQNQRQFVVSQSFVGPDRRRKKGNPPSGIDERRREGDKHATIVYSADNVAKPKDASDVWLFRLPNHLKEKVGAAGMKGPLTLPNDLLEQAEETLERQSADFADWADGYLKKLVGVVEAAGKDVMFRRQHMADINGLAHELRGQGGTFGYPLITIFGKSLYECTMPGAREDDNNMELIKAHVQAMRAVIRDKVSGDGGELGRELLKSLKVASQKYGQPPPIT